MSKEASKPFKDETLTCKITGNTMPPDVIWFTEDMNQIWDGELYRVDRPGSFDYHTTTLTVRSWASEMTGNTAYICRIISVENGYEELEATVHLHFISKL